MTVEFSIIIETYNLVEGTDSERFHHTVQSAIKMAAEQGEVLIADAYGVEKLGTLLEDTPGAQVISAIGKDYDSAKMVAARAAKGKYILYLDADCEPSPGWHSQLLEVLQRDRVRACCGFTLYRGGFMAAITSVMDFGFLLPRRARKIACYASNNCVFHKDALQAIPIPSTQLRCSCYYHTHLLARGGIETELVPDATVWHDPPPLVRERTRRGHDIILASRVDPELPEAHFMRLGIFSIPLFYWLYVWLDWKRLWAGKDDLPIAKWQLPIATVLFPILRWLDVAGMVKAFIVKTNAEPWGSYG